jgi:RNA polymerase sigma-70 factor (ECF subfamily)
MDGQECVLVENGVEAGQARMTQEQQLIALAREGDAGAFGELVKLYKGPIQRYLYKLTGDVEQAGDLTQDTFLKAYQNLNSIRSDLAFKPWLYRIATRTVHSAWRRARLKNFINFDGENLPGKSQIEDTVKNLEEKLAVRTALHAVPRSHRECLVLHFVEGFKYREIALTLGISEEAVRKRVARGKEQFKEAYKINGGEM